LGVFMVPSLGFYSVVDRMSRTEYVPRLVSVETKRRLSAFLACNFDKTLRIRAPLRFGPLTGQKPIPIVRPPLNEGWHDASHCVSSVCTEEETVLGRRVEPERRRS
jgi:hypothetical protein